MNQPGMNQPGMNQASMNQASMNQASMNQPGMNQPTIYQEQHAQSWMRLQDQCARYDTSNVLATHLPERNVTYLELDVAQSVPLQRSQAHCGSLGREPFSLMTKVIAIHEVLSYHVSKHVVGVNNVPP